MGITVGRELQQMHENGKGFKNKGIGYTAKQARQALRATTLKEQWGQQLICTVAILFRPEVLTGAKRELQRRK
jgi:hypothetical protein